MASGILPSLRPEERREAYASFATLSGFMTGHALLETARDSLFLAQLPASQLAWVYLAIAVLALLLMRAEPALRRLSSTRTELGLWVAVASLVTFGLWLLAGSAATWVLYAIYIWTGIAATLVVVRFWTVLGRRFTMSQAKRLFVFVGTGGAVGSIFGSALARLLAESNEPRVMLLAASGVFLLTSIVPRLAFRDEGGGLETAAAASRQSHSPTEVLELVWNRPYLRRVAVLVLTATMTFTLADYVFKSSVDRLVATGRFDAFFSTTYLTLHVLSLLVQLLLVSPLIRRLGVNVAQALVPALLLVSATGFLVLGGLGFALLLKIADGATRNSLHRTSVELLFVPVTGELRARLKAFIDVLGQRGGQALASLLILATFTWTSHEKAVAVLAGLTAAAWLYLGLELRGHYLNVFRETLNRDVTETRVAFPALDLASLETLLASLNDGDDRRVLAAIDLLEEQGKAHVIPALILYHPSRSVLLRALEVFRERGRTDFLPIAERLSEHPEPEVRAACLLARAAVAGDATLIRAAEDPSPVVQATALVARLAKSPSDESAAIELDQLADRGTAETRLAIARAARFLLSPIMTRVLLRLVDGSDAAVRLEIARAAGASRDERFIPPLIDMLGERALRAEARRSLVAIGEPALRRLSGALSDDATPHAVRRRLPRTISGFTDTGAAHVLLDRMLVEPDGLVRFKLLSAMGSVRARAPRFRSTRPSSSGLSTPPRTWGSG